MGSILMEKCRMERQMHELSQLKPTSPCTGCEIKSYNQTHDKEPARTGWGGILMRISLLCFSVTGYWSICTENWVAESKNRLPSSVLMFEVFNKTFSNSVYTHTQIWY